MKFANVALIKVVCICDKRARMHNKHDIKSSFSQNVSISKMQC
jgi:hypothetical protein